MIDVLVAGAGPAGALTALRIARAGARVVLVDREAFPRDKLCGDTLNPGAVRLLGSLGLRGGPLARATTLRGMRVTGPHAEVTADYSPAEPGLSIRRRDLDAWLLGEAIAAGVHFEPGLIIREPLLETREHGQPLVRGLVLGRAGRTASSSDLRLPAALTVGADGRRSVVARALGLVSQPSLRRWAFGVYVEGVEAVSQVGEMHIRPGGYVGIAPISSAMVNVCAVTGPRPDGRTPLEIVQRAVARDARLAARFSHATFSPEVRVLGPLGIDVATPGAPGLLLAGDAAGFVDPMTGDGIYLALHGAVLAADAALAALETGDLAGAVARLARDRRRALGRRIGFNRLVRRLVSSPSALDAAGFTAHLFPGLVRHAIRFSRSRGVNVVAFAIAVIFGMMAAEQRVSRSNERSLLARGAREPAGDVFRVMAVVYPLSFLAMGAEGAWHAWSAASQAGGPSSPSWVASGALLFAASKVLKYWAIRSLGDRWSFRVLVLPDVPLVATGPYRYVRHPNYVAVVGEIAGTAMMMEAIVTGPIAILAFGVVLAARIRFEERALGMAQD